MGGKGWLQQKECDRTVRGYTCCIQQANTVCIQAALEGDRGAKYPNRSPAHGLSACSGLPILCLFFWKGIQPAALLIVVQFRLQIKGTKGTKVLADAVNLLKNLHCFQPRSCHTHTHTHTHTHEHLDNQETQTSALGSDLSPPAKTKYVAENKC